MSEKICSFGGVRFYLTTKLFMSIVSEKIIFRVLTTVKRRYVVESSFVDCVSIFVSVTDKINGSLHCPEGVPCLTRELTSRCTQLSSGPVVILIPRSKLLNELLNIKKTTPVAISNLQTFRKADGFFSLLAHAPTLFFFFFLSWSVKRWSSLSTTMSHVTVRDIDLRHRKYRYLKNFRLFFSP